MSSSLGLSPQIVAYLASVNPDEHPELARCRQETAAMGGVSVMQISAEQGAFMQILARLIGAKRAFEIGVFTGYSALATALTLKDMHGGDAKLLACDVSEDWTSKARGYWRAAGVEDATYMKGRGNYLCLHRFAATRDDIEAGSPADRVYLEMLDDWKAMGKKRVPKWKVIEVYHDASFDKERAQQLYNSGVLTLRERAMAETLYFATITRIGEIIGDKHGAFEDIHKEVDATLLDRYFCNFSLFQSLPDSWAIDQLFPIIPIHRLGEKPDRRGTIQDMTCDSDGKIDRFVGGKDGRNSLELHRFRDGEDYILGID